MNTEYLPEMIEDLFNRVIVHAGDSIREEEVMKEGIALIRRRTIQEFNTAINRVKKGITDALEKEREEVP